MFPQRSEGVGVSTTQLYRVYLQFNVVNCYLGIYFPSITLFEQSAVIPVIT